ncbi:hypothetical protein GGI02_001516 [Coemansia sp. RSA 2322]|uniref:MARVEL domain-containing protein n=1 Tax=Coemansia thaxteri TaxID=2663907 RepID=A0A9W8BDN9_9FUNG|nr:hypothetical protein H4R26_006165 [Coemansia thaxteri]KAJ2472527.1 hypothetical protein GGI02_001516 [Coemansia sp. RSA 2322]
MPMNTSYLKLARFSLYLAAIVLAAVSLIVDAVALAALNQKYTVGLFSFSFGDSSNKGAAGFTMFVTLVSLILLPALAFGNVLVAKGFGQVEILNRVLWEMVTVSVLGLFWFIAAVVMASYASGSCGGLSVCTKFNAATAFAWLAFFAVLGVAITVGLMLHVVRTSGGDIKQALTHNFDSGYPNTQARAGDVESHPYPGAAAGGNAYYSSSPAVNMPVPGDK